MRTQGPLCTNISPLADEDYHGQIIVTEHIVGVLLDVGVNKTRKEPGCRDEGGALE